MKIFSKSIVAAMVLLAGISIVSCEDANEYEDARTGNPTWSDVHPDSLTGTKYVRASGIKTNVYGEDIQGFVESLDFVTEDSVAVKMSEGASVDDSNTEKVPYYGYEYNALNGSFTIKKRYIDDNKKVTFVEIFKGSAISDDKEYIVIAHFGDTPVQTYLVRQ